MRRVALIGLGLAALLASAARADDFDARRAKDIAAVVTANGASGELKTGDDGKVTLSAQAGRIYFDVNFDDCDTGKALCNTVTFSGWWDTTKLTPDILNRWNRWTLFCPAYLDAKGSPAMWYALAVSPRTGKDDVANAVDRWMGCLQDFDDFAASPDDFMRRNDNSSGAAPPADNASPPPPTDHPPHPAG
jgi:hypothetical protein